MRCVIGLVLFVVLYFGSCHVTGEVIGAWTLHNQQGYSATGARELGSQFVGKYHALIAVGAGMVTLLACSLPTMLLRKSEREAEAWTGQ